LQARPGWLFKPPLMFGVEVRPMIDILHKTTTPSAPNEVASQLLIYGAASLPSKGGESVVAYPPRSKYDVLTIGRSSSLCCRSGRRIHKGWTVEQATNAMGERT
jgi:hypothetical protein